MNSKEMRNATDNQISFKNRIVGNIRKNMGWLWTTMKNSASRATDWFKDKFTNKIITPKVVELVEQDNNVAPPDAEYWKVNVANQDSKLVITKIRAVRQKYGKERNSKYLKSYFYNDIRSLEDVHECLMQTYKRENNAFKVHLSFGYVTEKPEGDVTKMKLYHPGQQYFHDQPVVIKNKNDMNELISTINSETIIHKLTQKFPNSSTRLIGVYSMAVKVIRLDFPKLICLITLKTQDLLLVWKM